MLGNCTGGMWQVTQFLAATGQALPGWSCETGGFGDWRSLLAVGEGLLARFDERFCERDDAWQARHFSSYEAESWLRGLCGS